MQNGSADVVSNVFDGWAGYMLKILIQWNVWDIKIIYKLYKLYKVIWAG